MSSAADVLAVAAGEVGYSRWDDPAEGSKYGRWYSQLVGDATYRQNGTPYCAMFVSWVFAQAGASCVGLPGAYCPSMLAEAQAARRTTMDPQPGDVLYFDWGGDGEVDHVGIVVEAHGSYVDTIEGNTSGGNSGSQSNGGVVARRQRSYDTIAAFVRPDWDTGASTGTQSGGTSDMSANVLDVDGVVGPLTVSEWQRQVGTTVDGCVSGQLKDCQGSYPNLTAVTFEGTGSELMLEVQKRLGVPNPTGIIASGTISHLQGWLYLNGHSCAADKAGVLGDATGKALQESLNNGEWEA